MVSLACRSEKIKIKFLGQLMSKERKIKKEKLTYFQQKWAFLKETKTV